MKLMKKLLLLGVLSFCLGSVMTVEAKTISISQKNFPDPCFRRVLKEIEIKKDGKLTDQELRRIKGFSITYRIGANLKGMHNLSYLSDIKIYKSKVKNANELARIKSLSTLNIEQSNISSIKIKSKKLKSVMVKNNANLKTVDLSGCTNLNTVIVQNNLKLKNVKLLGCKKIRVKKVYNNFIAK